MKKNELIDPDFKLIEDTVLDFKNIAVKFLSSVENRDHSNKYKKKISKALPSDGQGIKLTTEEFLKDIFPYCTPVSGPRWFKLIVGGVTPAALMGELISSTMDQIPDPFSGAMAASITKDTLEYLGKFLRIGDFSGIFTTGTSASHIIGLITASEWIAERHNIDIAQNGIQSLPEVAMFGATPHVSFIKALRVTGFSRKNLQLIDHLPGRESMDLNHLEEMMKKNYSKEKIVIASAGTIASGDFDDLEGVSYLCKKYNAWSHLDGAFGVFARCSKKLENLIQGLEKMDSIAFDAHKWLNVPYESGLFYTKRPDLQEKALKVTDTYLTSDEDVPFFANKGIQLSQKFRALPLWFSFKAYGYDGIKNIIENNCDLAQYLSDWIDHSDEFTLLATTHLNIVLFSAVTNNNHPKEMNEINLRIIDYINSEGKFACGTIHYNEYEAIRIAICNWKTQKIDIDIVIKTLSNAYKFIMSSPKLEA